jgi:hypothetical protein
MGGLCLGLYLIVCGLSIHCRGPLLVSLHMLSLNRIMGWLNEMGVLRRVVAAMAS